MNGWIILRTSGGQTLALARSLDEAGYDAWTPARTLRRFVRANTPSGKRPVETEIPILPTFVFARAAFRDALVVEAARERSAHPSFSVFHVDGFVPHVHDLEIEGLRAEEAAEAATIGAIHAAETHAEADRIRIAAIKSAAARRRAGARNASSTAIGAPHSAACRSRSTTAPRSRSWTCRRWSECAASSSVRTDLMHMCGSATGHGKLRVGAYVRPR